MNVYIGNQEYGIEGIPNHVANFGCEPGYRAVAFERGSGMLSAATQEPPAKQRTIVEALTGEGARVVDYAVDGQLLRCLTASLDPGEVQSDIPLGFVPGEFRRIGVDRVSRAHRRGDLQVYVRSDDYSVLAIRPGRVTWYRTYGDFGVYLWVCDKLVEKKGQVSYCRA